RHYPNADDKKVKALANALSSQVYGYRYILKKSKARKRKRNDCDLSARVRFNCGKTADGTEEKVYRLVAHQLNNGRTVYYSADSIHVAVRRYPELADTFVDLLNHPTDLLEVLKKYDFRPDKGNTNQSLWLTWIQTLKNECKQSLTP